MVIVKNSIRSTDTQQRKEKNTNKTKQKTKRHKHVMITLCYAMSTCYFTPCSLLWSELYTFIIQTFNIEK